jgi:16S rRNA (guanine527-N7)-methyltransferase
MRRVLDVGSGGGFPGLPLKVCCPAIELTLVDAVRKKVSFLKHVIRELGLKNTRAWHARVEALGRQTPPPRFDAIVCRAFSDLAFALKHLAPLLDENGRIVFWKGRRPDQEIQQIMPLIAVPGRTLTLTQQSYRLPFFEAQRTLVILTTGDRGLPEESLR